MRLSSVFVVAALFATTLASPWANANALGKRGDPITLFADIKNLTLQTERLENKLRKITSSNVAAKGTHVAPAISNIAAAASKAGMDTLKAPTSPFTDKDQRKVIQKIGHYVQANKALTEILIEKRQVLEAYYRDIYSALAGLQNSFDSFESEDLIDANLIPEHVDEALALHTEWDSAIHSTLESYSPP